MADIVEAFVASLSLDPRQYNDEIKKYRADRKKLRQEEETDNKRSVEGQTKLAQGVKSVRNEVVGLFAIMAGARGLTDFVSQILSGDAATGRLAANLGVATTELSAWEGAITRVGGKASDADQALRAMATAVQNYKLTGTTGIDADLMGLGVGRQDVERGDPGQMLLQIAGARGRMSQQEYAARLGRIGLDENTINLLARGRSGVSQLLEEQRKLGVVTDRDAEAAEKLQERWAILTSVVRGQARPQITAFVDLLLTLATNTDIVNNAMPIAIGLFGAIGIAAATAYAPIIGMATAIAGLAVAFERLSTAQGRARIHNNIAENEAFLSHLWGAIRSGHGDVHATLGAVGGVISDAWNGKYRTDNTGGWGSEFAGGAAPTAAGIGGSGRDNGAAIRSFFQANGFTAAQARGIEAGIFAESGSDPNRVNPQSGAYGLAQHLSAGRLANFKRIIGRDIRGSSLDQQLRFILWELRNTEHGAGISIAASNDPASAARAFIDQFERPGPGASGDYRRAGARIGLSIPRAAGRSLGSTSTTTSIGQITIYTAATDAQGIAHDLRGELNKRGVVVQANSGLGG